MKKYKDIIKNKYVLLGISAILLMIVVQASYAFFMVNFGGEKTIELSTPGLKFSYKESGNAISLSSNSPISDATGKVSATYFDFEVKYQNATTDTLDYYIYLEKDLSSTISDEYIKVYLTDQSNIEIVEPSLFNNLQNYSEVANSKVLYTNSITSSGTETIHTYRLRVWIDETYEPEITNTPVDGKQNIVITAKTYKFKVGVSTIENTAPIILPPTDPACFVYTTDSTSATITGWKCYAGNTFSMPTITDVVIPNELGGKTVKVIAENVFFRGYDLEPPLPGIITNNVHLTSVVLSSELVTIGRNAFSNNNLTGTLTIPATLKTIESYAFEGECGVRTNQITKIIFEAGSELTSIGDMAFGCNNLSGKLVFPVTLKTIGSNAFQCDTDGLSNQITEVVFPNGLTTIGAGAFLNNKISGTLTIPATVTTIGNNAFRGTLTGTTNQITEIVYASGSQLKTIGESAFLDNQISGTLTIPATVTTIGQSAFGGNKISGILSIPATLKTIGASAFSGGTTSNQITGLVFETGSQLTEIGNYAFQSNKISGILTIPATVTYIGTSAFQGGTTSNQITGLVFETGSQLTMIGNYAFRYNKISGTVTIPPGVTSIGNYAFYKDATSNTGLTNIINPTGRSFDWNRIITGAIGTPAITGLWNGVTVSAS